VCCLSGLGSAAGKLRDVREPLLLSRERARSRINQQRAAASFYGTKSRPVTGVFVHYPRLAFGRLRKAARSSSLRVRLFGSLPVSLCTSQMRRANRSCLRRASPGAYLHTAFFSSWVAYAAQRCAPCAKLLKYTSLVQIENLSGASEVFNPVGPALWQVLSASPKAVCAPAEGRRR
jgi:hypothetical protein